MEETYQLIEGSPTLRDLDAENGFLWCPFGHLGRQNEPGILISRLDDGSYDVRLGTGFDSPIRFAIRDLGMLRIVGHAAVLIFQAALLTCLLSFRLLVIPDKHRDDSLNAPKNSSEHYERHEGFYHCVHLGFLFLLCG